MNQLLFIGGLGMQELLVILLIVLLLFGGKKLPEMMRGLGQGVKAFKDGMQEDPSQPPLKGEEKAPKADTSTADSLPLREGKGGSL